MKEGKGHFVSLMEDSRLQAGDPGGKTAMDRGQKPGRGNVRGGSG